MRDGGHEGGSRAEGQRAKGRGLGLRDGWSGMIAVMVRAGMQVASSGAVELPAEQGRWLEGLFRRYHRPELIPPDPLQVLRRYADPADREIVGLVAALLAYGNVKAILGGVEGVLERLGERPARYLCEHGPAALGRRFEGFRYRVTSAADLTGLLVGARGLIRRHGSLDAALGACLAAADDGLLPGLGRWADALTASAGRPLHHLLPHPGRGSACKRLMLYLRWMVRRDAIDPGGWTSVSPARLIAPVDTHMHQVALALGWTRRRQANLATALEVTAALRGACPADPIRYDFALTRPGIRREPWPALGVA